MKTRVAVVLFHFCSGGAEHMISRLVSNLDTECFEAEVICIYGEPYHNALEKAVTDHGVPIVFIGKGRGFSLKSMLRLNRELSRFKPDIVHTHLSACVYCASWILTHKRTVMLHTIHNMPVHELSSVKKKVMKLMYRRDNVVPVAISHEIRRQMGELYKLRKPAELVYNPVDVKRFQSVERKPHDGFVLITAGRLSAQKNQKRLIRAFAAFHDKVRESELYILGEGEFMEELSDLASQLSLSSAVHLTGNVDCVPEYFAGADLFVLTSDYEGLPLVLLEAMAAGLPVVSTDIGGIKDIIKDNGILVKPAEDSLMTAAFADAFYELYQSEELRNEYAKNGLSRVHAFDSSVIADEYEDLYKKYAK